MNRHIHRFIQVLNLWPQERLDAIAARLMFRGSDELIEAQRSYVGAQLGGRDIVQVSIAVGDKTSSIFNASEDVFSRVIVGELGMIERLVCVLDLLCEEIDPGSGDAPAWYESDEPEREAAPDAAPANAPQTDEAAALDTEPNFLHRCIQLMPPEGGTVVNEVDVLILPEDERALWTELRRVAARFQKRYAARVEWSPPARPKADESPADEGGGDAAETAPRASAITDDEERGETAET